MDQLSQFKKNTFVFLITLFSCLFTITATAKVISPKERLSYTIGADIGENFRKQGIEIDSNTLLEGINDAINNQNLKLSSQEMETILHDFQRDMIKKRAEDFKKTAKKNKENGEKFLTENAKKASVKKTKSGLQYEILRQGDGKQPKHNDTVTVRYKGSLINGTVFDSTEKTGKPVTFKLTDVIKGWTEALQMMSPGAYWKIYIPSELAYGEQGVGGPIGPNETLIFEIELLKVKPTSK